MEEYFDSKYTEILKCNELKIFHENFCFWNCEYILYSLSFLQKSDCALKNYLRK